MATKKIIVELDDQERARLYALISKGKAPAKAILKAPIHLKADQAEGGPAWLDAAIVEALDTNLTMVLRVCEKLVTEGPDAVLTRWKRETPPIQPIFDGEAQAKLTALACSEPPAGHARWERRLAGRDQTSIAAIRLLAEHVVERKIVPATHFNTVGHALKKRFQTALDRLLGYPAESQRRLCRGDGGRARRLHEAARSGAASRLPRRNEQTACQRVIPSRQIARGKSS
jgi:hypothetical protein